MKITKILGPLLLLAPLVAAAETGTVVKDNVCSSDNIIIETDSGWYVAAEWYGGPVLFEGLRVYGNMLTYGMVDQCDSSGNCGPYWIEDYESNIGAAFEELCD